MCSMKFYILFLFLTLFDIHALNCKSEGGPQESELKSIYSSCLKKQEGRNSSNDEHFGSHSDDEDTQSHSKEPRGRHRPWDRSGIRDEYDREDTKQNRRNRNERIGEGKMKTDGRMRSREDDIGSEDMRNQWNNHNQNNGMGFNDRMGSGSGRFGSNGDDFMQNDQFRNQDQQYNAYGSNNRDSNDYNHRYKREKRLEMNSGHRSQYNPNSPSSRSPWREDSQNSGERNSSNRENSMNRDVDSKACALHCFLEELEMVGDNGLPDRYLVTHIITKDVDNEDLKDFLQESIEDCFQVLYNENTEDRCKFSKDLMMCLSEKGRANCDDWKDDIQF